MKMVIIAQETFGWLTRTLLANSLSINVLKLIIR